MLNTDFEVFYNLTLVTISWKIFFITGLRALYARVFTPGWCFIPVKSFKLSYRNLARFVEHINVPAYVGSLFSLHILD